MGKIDSSEDEPSPTDPERNLRGDALTGAERKRAVDHAEYEKRRNPDTELHLDDEEDTLYNDGLDLEDDSGDTLAGTRGDSHGIKP